MSASETMLAMIDAHFARDDQRFTTLANQAAARARRSKHDRVAERIEAAVKRGHRKASIVPGAPADLIFTTRDDIKLSDIIAGRQVKSAIEDVIREFRANDRLAEFGLTPASRILLSGPPGTGKTMTASALANELDMPLMHVKFSGVISSHLGESAKNLDKLFSYINSAQGLFFFDEFDSIGRHRSSDDASAAFETNRVVNELLKALNNPSSGRLLVFATNHAKLLDRALFRRFDTTIHYKRPNSALAINLAERTLNRMNISSLKLEALGETMSGLSHSEIVSACESAMKASVLEGVDEVKQEILLEKLKQRKKARGKQKSGNAV